MQRHADHLQNTVQLYQTLRGGWEMKQDQTR